MFERILVPLDGSSRAELILSQVGRLLRRKDSKVLLLRVVSSLKESSKAEREQAERYIDELIRKFSGRGARVGGRVLAGPIAPSILKVCEKEKATLIAMTTHGRAGLPRWLLGSVAEKVVRASSVPVLLVRSFQPGGEEVPPATAETIPFRKILVPTDGSRASATVVDPATEFAQLFDSEILVVHAEYPFILPGPELASFPAPALTRAEDDDTTAAVAEAFRDAGIRVTRRTELGDAASVILDQSKSAGIDLIAMATHGRSGLSRWVLGSVAEQVLRHGAIPLLLVPVKGSPKSRGKK
ncbi:MAG TPA: universal stress protein [Planctomycetota bacterium]|nr:universal stress protein [Planctomycetota bacterium]